VVVGGYQICTSFLGLMLRELLCARRYGVGWCDGSASFIPGLVGLLSGSQRKALMLGLCLDRLWRRFSALDVGH